MDKSKYNRASKDPSQLQAFIDEACNVAGNQATVTIMLDELTNLNGRELTAYESTDGTYDEYPIKTITYGGETLTRERAENYMEYMTGSRFLPVYNYEKPQNSLFIMADGTFWKPQFDEENGLILFKFAFSFPTN